MDRSELEDLLSEALTEIIPGFSLSEDGDGQIVILTGLSEDIDSGELIPIDDSDPDADPDFEQLGDEDD